MASAGGLSLQEIGFNDKGMASLPASSHSHSFAGIRGSKTNTGRGDNCQGPTFGCDSILEDQALALGTSVQKAELIALMHALQLAAEKLLIYTDSKYAFTTLHVYGEICISLYIYI
jgi:hypothetical protein